ncbi:hypothetical protein [Streptomyces sp. TP-A0874]|uniref:hypothetical protein n=1 Tax=Streptomyces sp. TP-A0874 TaxID=549819 RepID=UPI0008533840|nr:hypothetical protein [Streptomyces sp. TP-A0874]
MSAGGVPRPLPFPTGDDKPAFLISDGGPDSLLSMAADGFESMLTMDARNVAQLARETLEESATSETQVRWVAESLLQALDGVLRICDARGAVLGRPID